MDTVDGFQLFAAFVDDVLTARSEVVRHALVVHGVELVNGRDNRLRQHSVALGVQGSANVFFRGDCAAGELLHNAAVQLAVGVRGDDEDRIHAGVAQRFGRRGGIAQIQTVDGDGVRCSCRSS